MNGIERIAKERQRQISVEGWTPQHDDEHKDGEIAIAAACYAAPYSIKADICRIIPCSCREATCQHFGWPWNGEWDKRGKHERIRQLEIAGALLAAEIDRLLRESSI